MENGPTIILFLEYMYTVDIVFPIDYHKIYCTVHHSAA